ncbi:serine protease nudel-like [Penaeus indicus]|uniref:serine protease nudel-like n=1 Tax=Penaeus indicus TaxID=29960 RepID=UPI00300C5B37
MRRKSSDSLSSHENKSDINLEVPIVITVKVPKPGYTGFGTWSLKAASFSVIYWVFVSAVRFHSLTKAKACSFPPGVKFRCDEEIDCLDFADERGCGVCYGKELSCTVNSRPRCLSDTRVCDGRPDCDNGSDEHLCSRLISDLNNYKEHEPVRRKGYVQVKRNNKWHMMCFAILSRTSYYQHRKFLGDLCQDIAGSSRCGKETIRFINIHRHMSSKWPSQADFLQLNLQGQLEVSSCRSSLIGYLKCAQPCGRYGRTRRDAGDTPSGMNNSSFGAVVPPASPTTLELQDAKQDDEAHWEQMFQRFLKQEQEQGHMDSRIVGGTIAVRKDWPFIVSLNYRGFHFCGGSIISAEWVLSAAHCLYRYVLDSHLYFKRLLECPGKLVLSS